MNNLGIEEDFYYELVELMNSTEANLLELEKGFDDTITNSINRLLHSLKGNCGMLELHELETVFHTTENIFLKQVPTQEINIDLFLNIMDDIKAYFSKPDSDIIKKCLEDLNLSSIKEPKSSQLFDKDLKEKISHKKQELNALTIFHIDDDPEILEVMSFILLDYGCKVHSYTSIPKMREDIIAGNIPDLFIIDFKMPDQNGNQVVNGLNSILPHIPKIILSGFVNKEVMFESMNRGVIGILEKPVDIFYLEKFLGKAKKLKNQHIINSKVIKLTMQVEYLSHKELVSNLEEIKKLINS